MSITTTIIMSHATSTTIEQGLICMIEGCDAIGEETIAFLDESSLSENVDYPSQGSNLENNSEDNLIPAIVCGKHFDKLMEAYYCQD